MTDEVAHERDRPIVHLIEEATKRGRAAVDVADDGDGAVEDGGCDGTAGH